MRDTVGWEIPNQSASIVCDRFDRTMRVQAAVAQAQAAASFLTAEYGTDGVQLVLGVNATLADIEWDEDRTPQAEAAWERLGSHLGFTSIRPEKLYGKGPDNLWALAGDRHAVIEMKTGCTTNTIAKKDVDQLGGSVRWDQDNHPGITSIPIMVHPSRIVNRQGTPVDGMRVITAAKLDELKTAVRSFAVALADGQGRWSDEQGVSVQLTQARLTAGKFLNAFTEVIRANSGDVRRLFTSSIVHEERVRAVNEVWSCLVEQRRLMGGVEFLYDVLVDSEYPEVITTPVLCASLGKMTLGQHAEDVNRLQLRVSMVRPHIPENLYQQYRACASLTGRLHMKAIQQRDAGVFMPWTELDNGSPDLPLRQVARELIPQDELDGYWAGEATGIGTRRPLRPLIDAAERGVLSAINLVLSGLG